MNTLFGDEVQLAKGTSPGSIPFEGAIARVNALDWRQVGTLVALDGGTARPRGRHQFHRRAARLGGLAAKPG